jgi:adenylate cyclase
MKRNDSPIMDWLLNGTQDERYIDNILVEMCKRLKEGGVPVDRTTMHFRTQHPEWRGARLLWRVGMQEAEITTFGYHIETSPQFLNSPVNDIFSGAAEVRERLGGDPEWKAKYPLYDDLRSEGLTDYVAWPMDHTQGKRHVVTFATEATGGFTGDDIGSIRELLPALSLLTEIRLKNILARTLLQTYVGPRASEQILAGAVRRGSGETVNAAVLICDLRDFTAISDLWPRDDVIELLNTYFDAMCEPIERHGGEILKFMGDGLLAIFPLDRANACQNLLTAVQEARAAIDAINESGVLQIDEKLRYGVGVHVGDVMYGNIGSRKRLDFTVIGPVVNIASRLETLTKDVQRPVLLSRAFVDAAGLHGDFESLGSFPLRGLNREIEVFALPDKPVFQIAKST